MSPEGRELRAASRMHEVVSSTEGGWQGQGQGRGCCCRERAQGPARSLCSPNQPPAQPPPCTDKSMSIWLPFHCVAGSVASPQL